MRGHTTHGLFERDRDLVNPGSFELFERGARELAPFLHEQVVGPWMTHILGCSHPNELVRLEHLGCPPIVEQNGIFAIEIVQ